jgi:epoxyqueuosine reductase
MIYPELSLDGAKSIVVMLEKYRKESKYISKSSVGRDYHLIVKDKFEKLEEYLNEMGIKTKSFVDTGPLLERELALRAGLGFIGKNNNFISYKNGSYVFIGYIIIDKEIEVSDVLANPDECGECNRCINSCPSKALVGEYKLNGQKCMSYISQKKDCIRVFEDKIINIYGCDICQDVCPYNKDIKFDKVEDIDLEFLINMTNVEFKENFKNMAAGWRGKNLLKRNAAYVILNKKIENKYKVLDEILKMDVKIFDEVKEYIKKKRVK